MSDPKALPCWHRDEQREYERVVAFRATCRECGNVSYRPAIGGDLLAHLVAIWPTVLATLYGPHVEAITALLDWPTSQSDKQ